MNHEQKLHLNFSYKKLTLLNLLLEEDLDSSLSLLLPLPRNANFPLSFVQQRLWFLDQLELNSSVYNIPIAYRLRGELNMAALEQSLKAIVHRHEVLRTTFPSVDGQPSQVIAQNTQPFAI